MANQTSLGTYPTTGCETVPEDRNHSRYLIGKRVVSQSSGTIMLGS